MNLILIRHGEIPSNVNRVYAGRSSEALTDKGVQQAEETAGKVKDRRVDAMYSSPIHRALQTAYIIGMHTGMNPVVNSAFREMEMGPWEGMSESDIAGQYPGEWELWNTRPAELRLPGRETLDELQERVLNGVRDIYEQDRGENIVIVTHVAVIRVLLLWHSKKDLNLYKTIHVPNAEVFDLSVYQEMFS